VLFLHWRLVPFAFLSLDFVSTWWMCTMPVSATHRHSFAINWLRRTLTDILFVLLMKIIVLGKSMFLAMVSHNSTGYVSLLSWSGIASHVGTVSMRTDSFCRSLLRVPRLMHLRRVSTITFLEIMTYCRMHGPLNIVDWTQGLIPWAQRDCLLPLVATRLHTHIRDWMFELRARFSPCERRRVFSVALWVVLWPHSHLAHSRSTFFVLHWRTWIIYKWSRG